MLDRQFLAILREEGAGLPIRTVRLGAEGLGKSIHPGVRRGEEDVDCIAGVLTLAQTMGQWEDKQKNGRAVASTASVSRGSHKCGATTRPIQRVRHPVHEQDAPIVPDFTVFPVDLSTSRKPPIIMPFQAIPPQRGQAILRDVS